ncbi:MAG: DUF3857 domain-containing protein [Bacteroidales bacterium]|nr:DUF3857 domain-containing protein [Bacteroidales bacterium]
MIHKILLLALSLFTGITVMAQEEKSDAVYQEQTREYTLNKDGSWSYHYSHKLLINTYLAFHNLYGEDFIVYDPAFQKLKVNRSVTTMADGKQVASPENAYNELLPGFAANVPVWNRLREMVVTHTALERGATIDFDYTLTTAKGYTQALMGNEQLWMNSPVKKLTFIIHTPSGSSFNYEQFGIQTKPAVSKQGGKTTYTWALTDVPAAMREDFRAKEQQNRSRIVFVASPKTADAVAVFASQEAFKCEIPADVKAETATAVSGIDKPLLKALKLQEKVANELNTWQVPLQYSAYKLRNVATMWQSNGGTEAEKAVLLTAMLRSLNIQAEPVAVVADRFYSKKGASPAIIERFLVKVSLPGMEPVFLSPTQSDQQDLRFTLAGKRIISLVPGKIQSSEVIGEPKNLISLTGNLELTEDLSLTGKLGLELGGRLNPWLKLQKDSTYASSMLSGAFGNGKVTDIVKGKTDIDLSSFSFQAASGSFATEKAGHVFLKLPALPTGSDSWHMTELVSKRAEPLEIPFTLNESYDLFITIPEGMALVTSPVSLRVSNEFGNIEISISAEGKLIHVIRKINITNVNVPVEKYDAFRSMINSWNSKKHREIVLKKGN